MMCKEVPSSPSQPLSLGPAPCLTPDEVTEIFPPGQTHQVWKSYSKYHLLLSQKESGSGDCQKKTCERLWGRQRVTERFWDSGLACSPSHPCISFPLSPRWVVPLPSPAGCLRYNSDFPLPSHRRTAVHAYPHSKEGPIERCLAPALKQFSNLPS